MAEQNGLKRFTGENYVDTEKVKQNLNEAKEKLGELQTLLQTAQEGQSDWLKANAKDTAATGVNNLFSVHDKMQSWLEFALGKCTDIDNHNSAANNLDTKATNYAENVKKLNDWYDRIAGDDLTE